MAALGTGFLLGAANARYRDVGYVTPFLIQVWFFMTPVFYPSDIVPESLQLLYSIDPMV